MADPVPVLPAARPAVPLYTMPEPTLGQTVFWYPSGNILEDPQAGFVSRVGHDTICINLLSPSLKDFVIKDGVRHVTDPKNRTVRFTDLRDFPGCWDLPRKRKKD